MRSMQGSMEVSNVKTVYEETNDTKRIGPLKLYQSEE